MKSENESKRKHTRWYFWLPKEPFSKQTSGLAVQIYKKGWLKQKLGHAVIKDISLGGAGLLVSNSLMLPNQIIIKTTTKKEFIADVVYQRKEGELYKFLGVTWGDGNDDSRIELISQVENLTNQESREDHC
ncbi:PilZ domain-containing protein [uncultured Vibrio sp.]|uniref:PilZ domain-containing protein n=1 Tax=uncultured Vibrio sp. TaxID=114054 RepID=UPI0025D6C4B9|nr:PilZ domain-containing protein [uncultured Vibrio sp.]